MTISGTVCDATSGQPIPKFRIVTGWPNVDPVSHTTNATWSNDCHRFWLNFTGGKFQYTYDEEVISGVKDPTYVFKFEADGYVPFITRCVPATERSARFDVALTPGEPTEITVLAPDGEPAVNADVGLGSQGSRLFLVPGGLSHQQYPIRRNPATHTVTARANLPLPPDPTIVTVIAASAEGIWTRCVEQKLATNPVMTLLPYGAGLKEPA